MHAQPIGAGDPNEALWRWPLSLVLAAMAAGVLNVVPFWVGLRQMWDAWINVPEYSFGILIPPITAFLIWQQKDRLERMRFSGSWLGLVLVFAGGAILVVAQLATVFVLTQYAYFVTLYGLALALLGWPAFRLIVAPLLLLLLTVPLPQFAFANLSMDLQLLSSSLGVDFMRLFNVTVLLEGNVIDLGGYQLQVAEACSGLRYLFPLMTLGLLMAYFYKGALWKRIALFLSSVPITVLMNSLRVGTIGIMVEHWGIGMAEGFLHEFQGWALFMVSMALMLGEIALLNRVTPERAGWRQLFGIELPLPPPTGASRRRRSWPPAFAAALLLMIAIVAASFVLPRPRELIPRRDASFAEFPMVLGPWRGERETLDGVYSNALKLDDYLLTDYVDGSNAVVNLYIAYYDSQRAGAAVHSPRSCLPAGGWQMRDFGQRTVPGGRLGDRPLRVNRTLIELNGQRQLVYYWFQQRGRVLTNEFSVKWYIFWDALTRHRTDGALVRLTTPIPRAGGVAAADLRLTDLARRVAVGLDRYVPN